MANNALTYMRKRTARYVKNVGRSVGYVAIDEVRPYTGSIQQLYKDARELSRNLRKANDTRRLNAIQRKTATSTLEATASNQKKQNPFVKNMLSDIKSGKLYNKKRMDRSVSSSFSFGEDPDNYTGVSFNYDSDDFGDYETAETANNNVGGMSADASTITKAFGQVGMNTAMMTAEVSTKAAEYIAQSNNMAAKAIYEGMNYGFSSVMMGLNAINMNLQLVHQEIGSDVKGIALNASKFFIDTDKYHKESLELLKKIASGVDQISKATAPAPHTGTRKSNIGYDLQSILTANGTINFRALKAQAKKGFKEDFLQNLLLMLGIGTDTGGSGASLASNPIGLIIPQLLQLFGLSMVPNNLKRGLHSLNTSVRNFGGNMLLRARNADFTKMFKTGPLAALAPFLNDLKSAVLPKSNYTNKINTGNYNKGRVNWDGIARKSLVEVIPVQLGKILSAITGEEEMRYDFNNGKWTKVSSAQQAFKTSNTQAKRMAGGDFYSFGQTMISRSTLNPNDKARMKEMLDNFNDAAFDNTTSNVGALDYLKIINPQYPITPALLKMAKEKYGIRNRQELQSFRNLVIQMQGTPTGRNAVTGLATSMAISKDNIGRQNRYKEHLNDSMINMHYDDSTTFGSKRGNQATNNILGTDQYGHDVFFYLQGIYQYTQHVSNNLPLLIRGSSKGKKYQIQGANIAHIKEVAPIHDMNIIEQQQGSTQTPGLTGEADFSGTNARAAEMMYDPTMPNDMKGYVSARMAAEASGAEVLNQFLKSSEADEFEDRYQDYLSKRDKQAGRRKGIANKMKHGGPIAQHLYKALNIANENTVMILEDIEEGINAFSQNMGLQGTGNQISSTVASSMKDIFARIGDTLTAFIPDWMKGIGKSIFNIIANSEFGKATKAALGKVKDFFNPFKDTTTDFWNRARNGFNGQAATGRNVTKTGIVAVSEGEMIIPSEMNPYYHGRTNKTQQIRDEQRAVRQYFGSYAPGGTAGDRNNSFDNPMYAVFKQKAIEALKNTGLSIEEKTNIVKEKFQEIVSDPKNANKNIRELFKEAGRKAKTAVGNINNNIKQGAGKVAETGRQINTAIRNLPYGNLQDEYQHFRSEGLSKDKAYEYAKNNIIRNADSYRDMKDAAGQQATNRRIRTGHRIDSMSDFLNRAAEAMGIDKDTDPEKRKENIKGLITGVMKDYGAAKGAIGAGAVIGGTASILTGALVGPLAGAAIGAGVGLLTKSEAVQKALFGEEVEETDENGNKTTGRKGGLLNKKISDFITKHVPSMAKGGGIGAAAGLFLGSPVLGAIVGSAVGYVQASDKAKDFLFGKIGEDGERQGSLLIPKNLQKTIKETAKNAFPKMALGAALGMVAGPFSIPGNIMIGSALGFAASTEKYRKWMYGDDKDFGKSGFSKLIKDNFLTPLLGSFQKITDTISQKLDMLSKRLSRSIRNFILKRLGGRLAQSKLGGKILDAGRSALGAVGRFVTAPVRMLDRGLERHDLNAGYMYRNEETGEYMSAADRIRRRDELGTSIQGPYNRADELLAGANEEELARMRQMLSASIDPDKEFFERMKNQRSVLKNQISGYMKNTKDDNARDRLAKFYDKYLSNAQNFDLHKQEKAYAELERMKDEGLIDQNTYDELLKQVDEYKNINNERRDARYTSKKTKSELMSQLYNDDPVYAKLSEIMQGQNGFDNQALMEKFLRATETELEYRKKNPLEGAEEGGKSEATKLTEVLNNIDQRIAEGNSEFGEIVGNIIKNKVEEIGEGITAVAKGVGFVLQTAGEAVYEGGKAVAGVTIVPAYKGAKKMFDIATDPYIHRKIAEFQSALVTRPVYKVTKKTVDSILDAAFNALVGNNPEGEGTSPIGDITEGVSDNTTPVNPKDMQQMARGGIARRGLAAVSKGELILPRNFFGSFALGEPSIEDGETTDQYTGGKVIDAGTKENYNRKKRSKSFFGAIASIPTGFAAMNETLQEIKETLKGSGEGEKKPGILDMLSTLLLGGGLKTLISGAISLAGPVLAGFIGAKVVSSLWKGKGDGIFSKIGFGQADHAGNTYVDSEGQYVHEDPETGGFVREDGTPAVGSIKAVNSATTDPFSDKLKYNTTRGLLTGRGTAIGLAARQVSKLPGAKTIAKGAKWMGSKVGGVLSKRFGRGAVDLSDGLTVLEMAKNGAEAAEKSSVLLKIAQSLKTFSTKIKDISLVGKFSTYVDDICEGIMDYIQTKSLKTGASVLKSGLKTAAMVLNVVFIVTDFISGWQDAAKILGVKSVVTAQKFVCGLGRALLRAIPFIGTLLPEKQIIGLICKIMGKLGVKAFKDLSKQQSEMQAEVDEYNEANGTDLTVEEYQTEVLNQQNIFDRAGNAIKSGFANVKNFFSGKKSTTENTATSGSGSFMGSYAEGGIVGGDVSALGKTANAITGIGTDTLNGIQGKLTSTIKSIQTAVEKGDIKNVLEHTGKIGLGIATGTLLPSIVAPALGNAIINKVTGSEGGKKGGKFATAIQKAFNMVKSMFDYAKKGDMQAIDALEISTDNTFFKGIFKVAKGIFKIAAFFGKIFNKVAEFLGFGDTTSGEDSEGKNKSLLGKALDIVTGFFKGNGSKSASGSGSGFISQFDSKYKGKTLGGKSIADNGCGPAAAIMAINQMKSRSGGSSMDSAIRHASRYQTAGGTDAAYFADEFRRNGYKANYMTNRKQMLRNIASGKPTVLLGNLSGGSSKAFTPFGPNNHYVVANGMDSRGNIIVSDPEQGGVRTYSPYILNQAKLGIAGGASIDPSIKQLQQKAAESKKQPYTTTIKVDNPNWTPAVEKTDYIYMADGKLHRVDSVVDNSKGQYVPKYIDEEVVVDPKKLIDSINNYKVYINDKKSSSYSFPTLQEAATVQKAKNKSKANEINNALAAVTSQDELLAVCAKYGLDTSNIKLYANTAITSQSGTITYPNKSTNYKFDASTYNGAYSTTPSNYSLINSPGSNYSYSIDSGYKSDAQRRKESRQMYADLVKKHGTSSQNISSIPGVMNGGLDEYGLKKYQKNLSTSSTYSKKLRETEIKNAKSGVNYQTDPRYRIDTNKAKSSAIGNAYSMSYTSNTGLINESTSKGSDYKGPKVENKGTLLGNLGKGLAWVGKKLFGTPEEYYIGTNEYGEEMAYSASQVNKMSNAEKQKLGIKAAETNTKSTVSGINYSTDSKYSKPTSDYKYNSNIYAYTKEYRTIPGLTTEENLKANEKNYIKNNEWQTIAGLNHDELVKHNTRNKSSSNIYSIDTPGGNYRNASTPGDATVGASNSVMDAINDANSVTITPEDVGQKENKYEGMGILEAIMQVFGDALGKAFNIGGTSGSNSIKNKYTGEFSEENNQATASAGKEGWTGNGLGFSGETANKFPYFNQLESPWASIKYGNSGTIKSAGCGPTSMAMILRSYGIQATPETTAQYSVEHGYRVVGTGTGWGFFPEIGAVNGLTVEVAEPSVSFVRRNLEANIPIIASMKPGTFTRRGHFIVFCGINGDNIYVNDPASRDRTNKSWNINFVVNQVKQLWAFSKGGAGSIGSSTATNPKADDMSESSSSVASNSTAVPPSKAIANIDEAYKILDSLGLSQSKTAFFRKVLEPALSAANEYGILPSLALAQTAQESEWGKSNLAKNHNNLFGMRPSSTTSNYWSGGVYQTKSNGKFKEYDSWTNSIYDYARLIGTGSSYTKVAAANNYVDAVNALGQTSYCTDPPGPVYASHILDQINTNKLYEFDGFSPKVASANSVETSDDVARVFNNAPEGMSASGSGIYNKMGNYIKRRRSNAPISSSRYSASGSSWSNSNFITPQDVKFVGAGSAPRLHSRQFTGFAGGASNVYVDAKTPPIVNHNTSRTMDFLGKPAVKQSEGITLDDIAALMIKLFTIGNKPAMQEIVDWMNSDDEDETPTPTVSTNAGSGSGYTNYPHKSRAQIDSNLKELKKTINQIIN